MALDPTSAITPSSSKLPFAHVDFRLSGSHSRTVTLKENAELERGFSPPQVNFGTPALQFINSMADVIDDAVAINSKACATRVNAVKSLP